MKKRNILANKSILNGVDGSYNELMKFEDRFIDLSKLLAEPQSSHTISKKQQAQKREIRWIPPPRSTSVKLEKSISPRRPRKSKMMKKIWNPPLPLSSVEQHVLEKNMNSSDSIPKPPFVAGSKEVVSLFVERASVSTTSRRHLSGEESAAPAGIDTSESEYDGSCTTSSKIAVDTVDGSFISETIDTFESLSRIEIQFRAAACWKSSSAFSELTLESEEERYFLKGFASSASVYSSHDDKAHNDGHDEDHGENDIVKVEIAPGVFERLRGAEETWAAYRAGFMEETDCPCCCERVAFVADADMVLCPTCMAVSLVKFPPGKTGGVGLGLRVRSLHQHKSHDS